MATRFLLNNYIDLATLGLDPGTEILNTEYLGLDNVKFLSKSRIARFKPTTYPTFYGTLNDPATISNFSICGHNFLPGVTVTLRLFDNVNRTGDHIHETVIDITSENAYIPGSTKMYNLPMWFSPVDGVSSFSLLMENPTLQYLQIYRLFMGEYIETSVGASLGNTWYLNDKSTQFRTVQGTLRTEKNKPNKVIEFDLNTIREIERRDLQYSLALVGKRKEFFVSVFENSCNYNLGAEYSGVVKAIKIPEYTEYANNIYRTKLIVEEV